MSPPPIIDSAAALAAACKRWRRQKTLAIDTEFVRTRTFFPQIGLIQINDGTETDLVDPVRVRDGAPLKAVLTDPGIVKVFYSCSEDIEVLFHYCGAIPKSLYDMQLAAAYIGHSSGGGYQALARNLIGVELPKHETRTNWVRRPLTDAQVRYAREDVEHLLELYSLVDRELRHKGRQTWAAEAVRSFCDVERFLPDPDTYYLRVGRTSRMKPRDLAVLQRLCAWREREARKRDRPRNFVLTQAAILALLSQRPTTAKGVTEAAGLHPREGRRSGSAIAAAIKKALDLPDAALPPPLPRRRRIAGFDDLVQTLRRIVEREAEALGIAAELLARRRAVEDLVYQITGGDEPAEIPRELNGWRRKQITDALLDAITQWTAKSRSSR